MLSRGGNRILCISFWFLFLRFPDSPQVCLLEQRSLWKDPTYTTVWTCLLQIPAEGAVLTAQGGCSPS